MNGISGARGLFTPQPPRLTPRAAISGPLDTVTIGASVHSAASLLPSWIPLAAAMPSPSPASSAAAQADLQLLQDLQQRGFRLLEKRRFWIPFVMKREREVSPERFVERIDAPRPRTRIASPQGGPVAFSRVDMPILHGLYGKLGVASLAHPTTAASLLALEQAGWRFTVGKTDAGAFGAYRSLASSQPSASAVKGGDSTQMTRVEDPARVRFFQGDGIDSGLSAPTEAAGLKVIGAQDRVLYVDDSPSTPEDVYRALYQDHEKKSLEVGTDEAPLLKLDAAGLASPSGVVKDLRKAKTDFGKLSDYDDRPHMWKALRDPIGGESFAARKKWMDALYEAEYSEHEAVATYERLRKLPGGMDVSVTRFGELREVCDNAIEAVEFAQKELDGTPGGLTGDEKYELFKQLLSKLDVEESCKAWRVAASAPVSEVKERAEQMVRLASSDEREDVVAEFEACSKSRRAGEPLEDVVVEYTLVRRASSGDQLQTNFDYVRNQIDGSLPGKFDHGKRVAAFLELLNSLEQSEDVVNVWRLITGADGKSAPPADMDEFQGRADAFRQLYEQTYETQSARDDYEAAVSGRLSGESIGDAVAAFARVRGKVGGDEAAVRDAFKWSRVGVLSTLPASITDPLKREMFGHWLDACEDFDSAREGWKKLAAMKGDFDDVLKSAMEFAQDDGSSAAVDLLSTLDPLRAKGEPLHDVAAEYKRLRTTLDDYGDSVLEAMQFMRGDLAKRPWAFSGKRPQELYGALLEATRSEPTSREYWKQLGGDDATLPADFPERFEGFTTLCKSEDGYVEQAMADFETLRDVHDGRPFPDRVKEFESLRAMIDAEGSDDGLRLYRWMYQDLSAAERAPYLRVQAQTRSFDAASEAWSAMRQIDDHGIQGERPLGLSAAQIAERADVLEHVVFSGRSTEVLCALLASRRPGEALSAAAASLDGYYAALPTDYADMSEAIAAFEYGRKNVAPADESLFVKALHVSQSASGAQSLWDALQRTGSRASLEARLDALQASGDVSDVVERLEIVAQEMPEQVDVDRAAVALLLAEGTFSGGAAKAAESFAELGGDRTAALEAMARLVAASREDETFAEAWDVVSETGAPGTPLERAQLVGTLLESTAQAPQAQSDDEYEDDYEVEERRREAVGDVLEMVRQLNGVAAGDFHDAAEQAAALMQAMGTHAADAAKGLVQLLGERNKGRFQSMPLGQMFERFATAYVTGKSVDDAVRAVEREAKGAPGTVENGNDEVVIGGIHVPKREE